MNLWLCSVKPRSWRIMKEKNLFGVPPEGRQKLSEVKVGDLLAIYVFKPIDGIVAIYRVISSPFEHNEDIWGGGRYPYRIRIEPIPEFAQGYTKPIPLHLLFGTFSNRKGITIEPYLRGVFLFKLGGEQLQTLGGIFRKSAKKDNKVSS